MEQEQSFCFYKGLQRPLEFMGLRGRYIVWGAGFGLGSFVAFAIVFAISTLMWSILTLVVCLGSGISIIAYKQKEGLHSKERKKAVYIVTGLIKS